jgi:Mrp family chromosome partitioning ATPase
MLLQSGPARRFAQQLPDNLWLLTSGFHTLDPESLLSTDRLKLRLNELSEEFDYVLIDTPPLNEFADAISVGQLADGVVLVLEANVTRRETTQKSKEALESASVNLLGAVLNKRIFPIPQRIYRRL